MNKFLSVLIMAILSGCSSTSVIYNGSEKPNMSKKHFHVDATGDIVNTNLKPITPSLYDSLFSILKASGYNISKGEKGEIKVVLPSEDSFKTSSAKLNEETKERLQEIVREVRKYPLKKIFIGGHTDSTGKFETNEALSGLRAQSVADVFFKEKIKNKVYIIAYGETMPVQSNFIKEGRKANRRIELVIY